MSDRYRGGGGGGYRGGGGGGQRRDYGDRQYGGGRGGYGGGGGRGGYGGDQRREGGGGYRGGGRRGGRTQYQSSFVGQKRGRDEPELMTPQQQLVRRLIKLGEPGPLTEDTRISTGDTPEKTFENAAVVLKQQIKFTPANLHSVLIEAVTSCSHKTMHYALLIGMVNVEEGAWVQEFVEAAGKAFEQQLTEGQVNRPRLLLRFFAALTHASVLMPEDVLSLMGQLMEVAQQHTAAGVDPSGSTWQPWTDQLVYAVLAGLVWGGAKLAAAEQEHARVLAAVDEYMSARPIKESVELRPMYGAADAADASAASDSGGASFLGQLWQAVQALSTAETPWQVTGLPLQLAESLHQKLDGRTVQLPGMAVPQAVPGMPADVAQLGQVEKAEAALQLQDRYPPRGGMVILDSQYTDAGRSAAERFVAEEYFLDLLDAWEGHRVELVQMLCSSLPLPYDYSGLLCETLFAQLLRLPAPRMCPLAFSGLIAHAALLRPAFPKYLAGSVRQLFLRVPFLAPELVGRLAEVLAHFITNMGFRWPWDRYKLGLEQPPGGPQRTFLVLVLQNLVRLTAWDHPLLRQETPEAFMALLGEAPAFQGLPQPVALTRARAQRVLDPNAPQQEEEQAAAAAAGMDTTATDVTMQAAEQQQEQPAEAGGDVAAAAAANGVQQADAEGQEGGMDVDKASEEQQGGGSSGQDKQQQQQQQAAEEPQDPISVWSGRLLGVLQARFNLDNKPFSTEQVLRWMEQEEMEQQLGSSEAVLRVVTTAVCAAGSKSCTHVYVMLERYSHLLLQQMQALGEEQGPAVLLEVLGHMYGQMPTRLHIALSRLIELEVLRPTRVISWLAAPERLQLGPAAQEGRATDAWELLGALLQEVFARHEGAVEAQARVAAAVAKAENLLTRASEEVAAAAAAEEEERAAGDSGRQRIPSMAPGGGGPMSRMHMAVAREEAASRKVAAAQQAASQQAELTQRLAADRADTLFAAFDILAQRIAEAAQSAAQAAAAAEQEAQQRKRQEQQQADVDMTAADGEGADADQAAQQQQDQQQEQPDEAQQQQEAAEAAAAKAEAARQLVLAQVRGFSMSFRSKVVSLQLTQRLQQAVEGLGLEPDLRAALLAPFGLA